MLESIAEAVMKLFDSAFVEEYKQLDQMACGTRNSDSKVYTYIKGPFMRFQYSDHAPLLQNDMSSMRSFKYSPRYQITFSLMNNDPEHLLVDWDIREAVKSKLKRVNAWEETGNLIVFSLCRLYASIVKRDIHGVQLYGGFPNPKLCVVIDTTL